MKNMRLSGSKLVTGGVLLACGLFAWNLRDIGYFAWEKVTGKSYCPWSSLGAAFSFPLTVTTNSIQPLQTDGNLIQFRTRDGDFWIQASGSDKGGRDLLAYLLSEHDWLETSNPESVVRSGDVVIDCGAHVGVFTRRALKRGARQVIAVEPDPHNIECLRRNFQNEIAESRVVIVPKGVWNTKTTLEFAVGSNNSGTGSAVLDAGTTRIQISVDTLDAIASEIGLSTVTYLKMDIEGAERNALAGASGLLKKYRPRLMLEAYHLPDDGRVLPALVKEENPAYTLRCGPCQMAPYPSGSKLVPYVIYLY